jgi:hypothetical protein
MLKAVKKANCSYWNVVLQMKKLGQDLLGASHGRTWCKVMTAKRRKLANTIKTKHHGKQQVRTTPEPELSIFPHQLEEEDKPTEKELDEIAHHFSTSNLKGLVLGGKLLELEKKGISSLSFFISLLTC